MYKVYVMYALYNLPDYDITNYIFNSASDLVGLFILDIYKNIFIYYVFY
jgi:hypothetical protein